MTRALLICDHGKIGTIKQAQALSSALGLEAYLHEVKSFFGWLVGTTLAARINHDEVPPSCVISAGRRAAPVALALKKKYPTIPFIHIMNPGWFWRSRFDLVITPRHDGISGSNVISVTGALAAPAKPTKDVIAHFKNTLVSGKPTLVMLIGGNTPNYTFSPNTVNKWCAAVSTHLAHTPMNVLISFSRRTSGDIRELVTTASQKWNAYIWDEKLPNPYPFFLKSADVFMISQDSVSMVSEAALTGKPVYLLPLESKQSKFDTFYAELLEKNHAQWFSGRLSLCLPKHPLDATGEAVAEIHKRGIL